MKTKLGMGFLILSILVGWAGGMCQVIQDGGFENQATTDLGDPWWIDTADGNPPPGATIVVEKATGEAFEGNNNVKVVTSSTGQWIAIGQDLNVEPNTTYLLTFYLKADNNIYWDGNPEWGKGYMKVVDQNGDALADQTVPHYYDGGDDGQPWTPGEIVFGGENMSFWRDYHYLFHSGSNTQVYLFIGTYVNNVVTWRVDGFKVAKLEPATFVQDGGFESQITSSIEDPYWIDTADGNPPPGSTMEIESGTGWAMEGDKNLKIVATSSGTWIAVGQDFTVEPYTDYVFVFHLKGDSLYWDGNPEWCKGYMKIVDESGNTLADQNVPHYCDRGDGFSPWTPGEVVFGNELMMRYWRDYYYPFNTGSASQVYLFIGSYVNDAATWRVDQLIGYKAVSQTGVGQEEGTTAPTEYCLLQNYPNPFNPSTTIRFDLARAENVTMAITDITGRTVRTLVNGGMGAGSHSVVWNGTDDRGNKVPSGMYFYKLQAGNYTDVKKLTFIQ